jgi:hypothetical protein
MTMEPASASTAATGDRSTRYGMGRRCGSRMLGGARTGMLGRPRWRTRRMAASPRATVAANLRGRRAGLRQIHRAWAQCVDSRPQRRSARRGYRRSRRQILLDVKIGPRPRCSAATLTPHGHLRMIMTGRGSDAFGNQPERSTTVSDYVVIPVGWHSVRACIVLFVSRRNLASPLVQVVSVGAPESLAEVLTAVLTEAMPAG